VTLPLSLGEWFLAFWPFHEERRAARGPAARRPVEVVVEEGELIFVPHGWWHCVLNLEDSVALTHNYVSSSNLADVLDFLHRKPDQISGVRDRPEALPAEQLKRAFEDALRRERPDLLAAASEELDQRKREAERKRKEAEYSAQAKAERRAIWSGGGTGNAGGLGQAANATFSFGF